MKLFKKIIFFLLLVFVAIQFIRPRKNKSAEMLPTDISKAIAFPVEVQQVFKRSCYDCHSNNTEYPWYAHVQPFGWFLANHIKDAKKELNFSEFGSYTSRRQKSKFKAIVNSIEEGSMPLPSYVRLHKNARLSEEDKKLIITWSERTMDSLSIKNN